MANVSSIALYSSTWYHASGY